MFKQKLQHQCNEKDQKLQVEEHQRTLGELKARVDQSSKALEKLMKENITLKKQNDKLLTQL